jgi:hypothetical protein
MRTVTLLATSLLALTACSDDPDGRPALPPGVTGCDPFGAPTCGAGETCTWVYNIAAPICAPAGPAAAGEPCDADTACAEGVCLSLDGTGSRCMALCRDAADCAGEACLDLEDAEFSICRLADLYRACDLLAPACGEGEGCYQVTGEASPICAGAGSVAVGAACTYANDCLAGDACIQLVTDGQAGEGACRDLCDPAGTALPACPDGTTCTPIPDTSAGFCAPAAAGGATP